MREGWSAVTRLNNVKCCGRGQRRGSKELTVGSASKQLVQGPALCCVLFGGLRFHMLVHITARTERTRVQRSCVEGRARPNLHK